MPQLKYFSHMQYVKMETGLNCLICINKQMSNCYFSYLKINA